VRVVIIGNGITGITAALEVRRLQPQWQITIISGEGPYFFSRPALMYIYMGHMRYQDTQPYEPWFWEQQRLELVQGWVTGIDTKACRVELDRGKPVAYDKLLVATGSKSNKFGWPGQDLDRVQGFYSLQDLESLEAATAGLRTAVIAGGGLIGIELAECLHTRGAHVIMLARETSYWNNILPVGESRLVSKVIRDSGIDLRLESELDEIVDDGKGAACAVTTKGGEKIDCQLVGLTAGVGPNLSALEGSDIEIHRGVLVDDSFQTSAENVYAAGDCAEIRTPEGERNKIEQLWYTGKMHGAVVGRLMAGEDASYDRGIWYNSAKFVDLEWHTYGLVPGQAADPDPPASKSLYWEHPEGRCCLRIAHEDGTVKGMNAMGIRHRHVVWHRWIEEERDVEYVLAHLGEGNFDPEFFVRHEADVAAALKEQLR